MPKREEGLKADLEESLLPRRCTPFLGKRRVEMAVSTQASGSWRRGMLGDVGWRWWGGNVGGESGCARPSTSNNDVERRTKMSWLVGLRRESCYCCHSRRLHCCQCRLSCRPLRNGGWRMFGGGEVRWVVTSSPPVNQLMPKANASWPS